MKRKNFIVTFGEQRAVKHAWNSALREGQAMMKRYCNGLAVELEYTGKAITHIGGTPQFGFFTYMVKGTQIHHKLNIEQEGVN